MMKLAILILLIGITFQIQAQRVSKKFYNKNWELSSKKERYYMREIFKENDSLFIVKDYYLIDSLEMLGHLISIEPEVENGLFTFYYASGFKQYEGNYCKGEICGNWIKYNKLGKPTDTINYDFDIPLCKPFDTTVNSYLKKDSLDYVIVDEMPKFISKEYNDFGSYIQKTLFIPPLINKYKLAGSVDIKFTVDVDGSLCGFEVQEETYNQSVAKEAMRILMQSPKWRPALSNRYKVPIDYMMPIKIE